MQSWKFTEICGVTIGFDSIESNVQGNFIILTKIPISLPQVTIVSFSHLVKKEPLQELFSAKSLV